MQCVLGTLLTLIINRVKGSSFLSEFPQSFAGNAGMKNLRRNEVLVAAEIGSFMVA